jgi:hypothetical protein
MGAAELSWARTNAGRKTATNSAYRKFSMTSALGFQRNFVQDNSSSHGWQLSLGPNPQISTGKSASVAEVKKNPSERIAKEPKP